MQYSYHRRQTDLLLCTILLLLPLSSSSKYGRRRSRLYYTLYLCSLLPTMCYGGGGLHHNSLQGRPNWVHYTAISKRLKFYAGLVMRVNPYTLQGKSFLAPPKLGEVLRYKHWSDGNSPVHPYSLKTND